MPQRQFPTPWIVKEHTACFIVKDQAGLNLAYVFFQNEPSCRSAAKLLSRAEARRIAIKTTGLPEFTLAKINHNSLLQKRLKQMVRDIRDRAAI
jgi:hypothetical protein